MKGGSRVDRLPHFTPTPASGSGFNRSATEQTRVVIFYVSEPGTPFLDPATP
jgi:hypothetical protein